MGPVVEIKTIRKPESKAPQVNDLGIFLRFCEIALNIGRSVVPRSSCNDMRDTLVNLLFVSITKQA
jgi:hypothetical protein